VTSAYEEARARGGLGRVGVMLLYETVDAVRRLRSYPPPPGHSVWTAEAVQELAHDFLADKRAHVAGVLLRASDDESFELLLETAVRNFIIDGIRKTSTGGAMRSLRRVVAADPAVIEVPAGSPGAGGWSLPDKVENSIFSGDPARLIDAAFAVVDARRARWRLDAQNRPPIAETDSVQRIVRAVLEAAAAPVPRARVLAVVLERFPLVDAPSVSELDDDTADTALGDGDGSARTIAGEIWDQLTDTERLVVGILDESARDIAAETGLTKSTAHRAMQSARAVVAQLLGDETDQISIIGELRNLSASARSRGTERAGLAFTHGEET
jgi:DNA-directed RNA polymerase specialized sigma24 family protein